MSAVDSSNLATSRHPMRLASSPDSMNFRKKSGASLSLVSGSPAPLITNSYSNATLGFMFPLFQKHPSDFAALLQARHLFECGVSPRDHSIMRSHKFKPFGFQPRRVLDAIGTQTNSTPEQNCVRKSER